MSVDERAEVVNRISVATRSGRVSVVAVEGEELSVIGGSAEPGPDRSVTIRPSRPSSPVEVRCPNGCDVVVGTTSGVVELRGALGVVHVTTGSGRVDVEKAESADLRTRSGAIEVGECSGECRVVTGSARVHIRRAGCADVSALSGGVTAERVGDGCVHTASGRVELGTSGDGSVEVHTISGAVRVTVPPGLRPAAMLRSLSGRIRCDCEPGADGRIDVSTTSGTIRVECE